VVHGTAGRLFAVAESGVKDDELGVGSHGDRPFLLDRIITRSYAQDQMYCAF
jgi:hydrogenase maturation factor HypE